MIAVIDIGGTKTLVSVFNDQGEVVEKIKFATPPDYHVFVAELSKTVESLTTKEFTRAVVAVPGKVDRVNGIGIAFGNLTWEDVPIAKDAEAALKCPVRLENDANLAGLSEAILILNDYKKVFYVTVSTGIGGIYVINGIMDSNTLDAEIGHYMLEHNGRIMEWEDFASGRAFVAKYGIKVGEVADGDNAKWYYLARNIAIGLIDVIASYTPEAIVVGGGVGTHLDKFKDRLLEELKLYETPVVSIPVILKAQRPEEAVIYGGYHLAQQIQDGHA